MKTTLQEAFQNSSLTHDELYHCVFFIFDCSTGKKIPEELIEKGLVIVRDGKCSLTSAGKEYRDYLLRKLATFYTLSEEIFKEYLKNELFPLKNEITVIKKQWRDVKSERLTLQHTLMMQGKDKAAIRKDANYKNLLKKQHALRTKFRHLEREYNKKLTRVIKKLGIEKTMSCHKDE